MRGVFLRPPRAACSERAVLAAIIGQALKDAQRGDEEAADWLDTIGPFWCGVLGLDEARAAAWRNVDLQTRPPVDDEAQRAAWRARGARYRERKRGAAAGAL